jgi:hypothetical protein
MLKGANMRQGIDIAEGFPQPLFALPGEGCSDLQVIGWTMIEDE